MLVLKANWFLLILVFFLSVAAITVTVWPAEIYEPLYGSAYEEPQRVVEEMVVVGQPIHVLPVVKCNRADEPTLTTSYHQWRRIEDGYTQVVFASQGAGSRKPGCHTVGPFENEQPPGVVPGLWILVAFVTSVQGGQQQTVRWATEPFRVVAE